ncbi:MAG: hypothetical protein RSE24_05055 [Oscillospiraceae bacterium]
MGRGTWDVTPQEDEPQAWDDWQAEGVPLQKNRSYMHKTDRR